MGDVFRFPLPADLGGPAVAQPLSRSELRAQLEEAAQVALDAADRIIAALDRMDGDPDLEDGGDAEPTLGAPEALGSQIIWLRGTDRDLEATSPEPDLTDERAIAQMPGAGRV